MAKDKQARRDGRVTVMAIGNLIAALVDTMRDANMPNDVVHAFLDNLDRLNELTLYGTVSLVMTDLVDVIRETVPDND